MTTNAELAFCSDAYTSNSSTNASKLSDSAREDSIDKTAMSLSLESHIVLRK